MARFGFGAGRRRTRLSQQPSVVTLAPLVLSSATLAENSAAGVVVGTLSGRTAGSTVSLLANDGNRFAIVGGDVVAGAVACDFEAGSVRSITVRETLAGASNSPRDTVLSISVGNVFEQPDLSALTLSATIATVGAATSIGIVGATAGSVISGTVPDGMTLNSAARTIGGTPTVAGTYNFALTETLADSANSPRVSNVTVTVAAAAATAPGYLNTAATAPWAVWGAHRLVSGYSGNLFTLRRTSDGATLNVAAQSGGDYPDYPAIAAWIGSSTATVTTIFDQTGNGRNLIQGTVANQPSFDPAQKTGNAVPILFDGYGRTTNAFLVAADKNMVLDAIALDRTALSAFAVAELKTSYNSFGFFTGSESGGFSTGQQELYIQNGAVTVRSGTDTRSSNVAEPRASKATVGYAFGPSTSYVYSKESWRGQGVALTSSTIGRLTLGKSIFGGSAFNGMYALFGMALYSQTLSNTTTGPAVVTALNAACEVPTAFQYTAVFNGDSILEGSGAARLLNTVRQMGLRKEGEVVNSAIHGTTLATQYSARTRFSTNLYNAGRPCVFFMQAGTNDLASTAGATLYANTATPYVTYLKGLGYKVVICTILPRTGSSGWSAAMENERLAYNAAVVANAAGADLVLDLASDPVMGPTTACADTSLYVDALHPATGGHARLASLYRAALQTVLRTTALGSSYVP